MVLYEHTIQEFYFQNRKNLLKEVFLRGRIIGILEDGFVLQDDSGRIDVVYKEKVNIGDIVSVSVEAEKILVEEKLQMIFHGSNLKILTPCRDEFFIGKDSPNYRRMVIDLNLKEKMIQRSKIMQKIRDFFAERGFLDVETPLLVNLPGMEPYLDVFKTEFVGLPSEGKLPEKKDLYLITSPEYALKKLLVAGFEKIFQLGKCFRNKETNGSRHNPEFTMIEWYRAYANYTETMKDTEELVYELVKFVSGGSVLRIRNPESGIKEGLDHQNDELRIDVKPPWIRLKVKDAFKKFAGVDYPDFEDTEKLRLVAQQKGYNVAAETSYDDLFFLIFMNEIEPKLGFDKPVILYEYPVSMASLSKKCDDDPRYSERFEAYIAGMELCNAFSDLTDPDEQLARLQAEHAERQKLGKEDYAVDQSFIRALQFGMPPCSGNALGVDRLVMLLTDSQSIEDVLFFPFKDLSL